VAINVLYGTVWRRRLLSSSALRELKKQITIVCLVEPNHNNFSQNYSNSLLFVGRFNPSRFLTKDGRLRYFQSVSGMVVRNREFDSALIKEIQSFVSQEDSCA
jgi:hypothetical protein